MTRFILLGTLTLCALSGGAEPASPCPPPPTEPAWLQDFTPTQKAAVTTEWEGDESGQTGHWHIEGTYVESQAQPGEYTEFEHESEIDARETWTCKGAEAEFRSITGTVETTQEWTKEGPEGEEEFESENRFEIRSLEEVRHVSHESEHEIEIETPGLTRTVEENRDWKQTWDETGHPTVLGDWFYEEESTTGPAGPVTPAAPQRQLASVQIPGFEPRPLPQGRRLRVKTRKHGKYNGPLEPLRIEMTQDVSHYDGQKLVEKKTIQGKQQALYPYDAKNNKYLFERMDFWHDEDSKNFEKNVAFSLHRWETWLDPEAATPAQTSFWKYSTKTHKFGASTEFIVKSDGHGILPPLFHIKSGNGTLTRTTDYSSGGRIIRFHVLHYPKQGNNTPLIDLKFSEFGKMDSLLLDDGVGGVDAFEDPFTDQAALYTLQSRINEVQTLESMQNVRYFPIRPVRKGDYPQVYQAPPKKD